MTKTKSCAAKTTDSDPCAQTPCAASVLHFLSACSCHGDWFASSKRKSSFQFDLEMSFKAHLLDKSQLDALALKVQKAKCVLSLPGGLLQRHGLPGGCEKEALGCTSYGQVFLISTMLGHAGRPRRACDLIKIFVLHALSCQLVK